MISGDRQKLILNKCSKLMQVLYHKNIRMACGSSDRAS